MLLISTRMEVINSDLLYEICCHLDFISLLNLLQSCKLYAKLSRKSRFKTLVLNQYLEHQITKILNLLFTGKYWNYTFPGRVATGHWITFGLSRNMFEISEGIVNLPESKEIIPNLISNKNYQMITSVDNSYSKIYEATFEELKIILKHILTR